MPDKPWKAWEREVAKRLGGSRRYHGGPDGETPLFLLECKHYRRPTWAMVEGALETVRNHARGKDRIGIVAVKRRGGRGNPTEPLVVMALADLEDINERLTGGVAGAIRSSGHKEIGDGGSIPPTSTKGDQDG